MADQREEHRKLIERIDKFGKDLSPKEINFIASCLDRLKHGRALSDPMLKWAQDIDDQKVGT
jgi:hypothetical protein